MPTLQAQIMVHANMETTRTKTKDALPVDNAINSVNIIPKIFGTNAAKHDLSGTKKNG